MQSHRISNSFQVTSISEPNSEEPEATQGPSVGNGWEAYAVGVGAWFALLVPTGVLNTIGTFQAYLGTHQLEGYSDQQIGWIFSMYPFL